MFPARALVALRSTLTLLLLLATELFLAWSYRSAFAPVLKARVQPDGAQPRVAEDALQEARA